MNRVNLAEIQAKEHRVREFLDETGYDGMVIGRKDNFAWFTCGGSNEVVRRDEVGFALLFITPSGIKLIAQVMDGRRIIDEELNGLEAEYVPLHWYQPPREAKATELIGSMKVVSDLALQGAVHAPNQIHSLHYPLTDSELEKLRSLGKTSEEIIRGVADRIAPGMKEYEIAAMLEGEYARQGISCDVLLVGSDERIAKYRHPCPSDKAIESYVLLHPAVQKWGLHANVTRSVYFGSLPEEIDARHRAACRIEAATVSMCVPGEKFSRILEVQKQLYRETGFEEEWRCHFQGGITGYLLADPTLCQDPQAEVAPTQAYDWFITITGAKVEELSMNSVPGATSDTVRSTGGAVGNGQRSSDVVGADQPTDTVAHSRAAQSQREICSIAGAWPTETYEYGGQQFDLPKILSL